jgi:hypothetical protein
MQVECGRNPAYPEPSRKVRRYKPVSLRLHSLPNSTYFDELVDAALGSGALKS